MLFRNSRELTSGMSKLCQNHRQVCREQREGRLFYIGKEKVGRVVLHKSSIGVTWETEM